MKKTLFALVVALLGVVLGVGGQFYYSLVKPPGAAGAPGSPGAPAAAKGEGKAEAKGEGKGAEGGAGKASGEIKAGGDAAKAAGSSPAGAASAAGGPPGAAAGAAGGAPKGGSGAPGGASPVEVAKPELLTWPRTVTSVGTLRSDESVTLRSEVAGRIISLNFNEGQRVNKGQALVKLDDNVLRAELEQARANQRLAKAKFDRAAELKDRGFISGQAKDEAENAMRVADASVQLVDARLSRFTIYAPFNGTAGLRLAGIGDYLKDGQDIVNLEKTDPIKVDFKVPELFMSVAKPGQELQIALDAIPGKAFTGKVFAINPQLDAAGRAVILRAQLPNRDASLRPGMFARVRLILSENADAITIPEQSLAPQGDEQFVFRVIEGRAARTKVEIGQRRDGKVEVVSGLTASDTVVTAGWQRIRDGAGVRVVGGGGPPNGGASKGGEANGANKGNAPKGDTPKGDGKPPSKSGDVGEPGSGKGKPPG
jgi:membrane fusion protein, multidrug efflux system